MEFDKETGDFIPPYEGWRPYCLCCTTIHRMKVYEDGWKCRCGNTIGKNLQKVKDD